jgi:hypothetical protein
MNREQQQIIDEAFGEYSIMVWRITNIPVYSKEEFINKCRTDQKFSEQWGLKIEERELSLLERVHWTIVNKPEQLGEYNYLGGDGKGIVITDFTGIPTKLITVTYNNETIESYE